MTLAGVKEITFFTSESQLCNNMENKLKGSQNGGEDAEKDTSHVTKARQVRQMDRWMDVWVATQIKNETDKNKIDKLIKIDGKN